MMQESIIYWNDAKTTEPVAMQSVLVVYEGTVCSGVYAKGYVLFYPEDFGKEQLRFCDYWAAFPAMPDRV